jgi:competence/damage-inducible protein CinA-like protein
MPSVEIVAVGTELLLGQLVDTNTPFIAGQLACAGIDVYATHAVGDNRARIAAALAAALDRADGAITTGGLGPTVDDLTKEAVCDVLGVDCERHAPTIARMERFFAQIGRPMRENNRKQADIPRGGVVLENARGTAPGFIATRADGKFVACMPGVPHEMKAMLVEQLIPKLRERFGTLPHIVTRVLHVTGLGESEIDHRIDDLFRAGENPKVAVLAHVGSCDVKIMAKARHDGEARALIAPVEEEVRARLKGHIYGTDDEDLAHAVLALLNERAMNLAVAESCTGGRIAAAMTAIPGASARFAGGVVAYANEAKSNLLGVPAELIQKFGAVSEEVALAMAAGARTRFNVEAALATTGIAGPGGGSKEKPAGLVWLAVDTPKERRAVSLQLPGDREEVQRRATHAALALLWRGLQGREPAAPPS